MADLAAGLGRLADRVGRIRLQIVGFIGSAAGLGLATVSLEATEPTRSILLLGGFMLFDFITNVGPNAQTYLLAGEVFPGENRAVALPPPSSYGGG